MREFSIYKGVSYDEPNGHWVAKWGDRHLGYYKNESDAARRVRIFLNRLNSLE